MSTNGVGPSPSTGGSNGSACTMTPFAFSALTLLNTHAPPLSFDFCSLPVRVLGKDSANSIFLGIL